MTLLEDLLGQLAAVGSPVQADRLLARALADSPCLLGPAQQVLDRLRGDAGHPRDTEYLAGGWWRVDDGLKRITEAAVPTPRARLHLAGLAGAAPLWIDPDVPVPPVLLGVAWEAALRAPLAIARPGRLAIGPYVFGLDPGAGGRTLADVDLVDQAGQVHVGTAVEVAAGEPLKILGHELAHAMGVLDEAHARRLGGLLARAAAPSR